MDAVITFVNGADPEWRESYRRATGVPVNEKRFRDWGTLKYLLRGIGSNLPFVRDVFLVVSSRSQVPQWLSGDVKVILHEDIIPGCFLPTFNSTTIELFLHRIPGLDEEFIYFNDDTFPILPCRPEDFFSDGRPAINFRRCLFRAGQFKKHTFNSYALACRASGLRPGKVFLRPQHTATAMLRSNNEMLCNRMWDELAGRISRLREDSNVNQYFFSDYLKLNGRTVESTLGKRHFSLSTSSVGSLRRFFQNPTREMICVNDTNVPQKQFEAVSDALHMLLEKRFSSPSRFEAK